MKRGLKECQGCRTKISSNADQCPKCGFANTRRCVMCKNEIANESPCPECGEPNPFKMNLAFIVGSTVHESTERIATYLKKPDYKRLFKRAFLVVAVFFSGIALIAILSTIIEKRNENQWRAEFEASKKLIAPSDLEINLQSQSEFGGYFIISGWIRNNSTKYSLTLLRLDLSLEDHLPSDEYLIAGETSARIDVNIPPGQVRDFSRSVKFNLLRQFKGRFAVSYEIAEIRGE